MRDILTVTLNPALDIATSVDHVVPGVKLRCSQPQTDPGGGGINVARAIQLLGGRAKAFVALGGDTGQSLRNLLESFEMDLAVYEAPGETRQSIAVTDLGLKDQFRFMLPGPHWKLDDIEKVTEAIRAAAPNNGYVILSGSGPSGSRADLYSRICAALADTGAKVIVDTSGPALTLLALGQMSPPYVLRMDQAEAESLTRYALPRREDTANFATELVERGAAEVVIVARGADGSIVATANERLYVSAAEVAVKSKVGAGDSFVGGFTYALAQGLSLSDAMARGSAAASAAVMT
ncbi:MAG: 1-phosphofructokinase family hexose kinase, partial [Rhodobacteraceae bacterium]|nr:1-phosphofructokinase family hexose kinase [Paracoccaceae bacterium]